MKLTAAGVAAVGEGAQASTVPGRPGGEIDVRVTAGAKRWAQESPLRWQPAEGVPGGAIVLDPSRTYQELLGFGGAFMDPSRFGVDELRQGVHVRGFELGKTPVFQDLGRKREILGQFAKDIHIRRVSGLGGKPL